MTDRLEGVADPASVDQQLDLVLKGLHGVQIGRVCPGHRRARPRAQVGGQAVGHLGVLFPQRGGYLLPDHAAQTRAQLLLEAGGAQVQVMMTIDWVGGRVCVCVNCMCKYIIIPFTNSL